MLLQRVSLVVEFLARQRLQRFAQVAALARGSNRTIPGLSEATHHYDIGLGLPARQGQVFAIGRQRKREDVTARKLRNLGWWTTVQGEPPDVRRVIAVQNDIQGFAIESKLGRSCPIRHRYFVQRCAASG